MTKVLPDVLPSLPSGSGVSSNRLLRLYSSKPICFDIIPGMGRMRIKKKDAVLPFRETMPYRLLLATGSLVLLFGTLYFLVGYIQTGNKVGLIISIAAGVMAGI